MSKRAVLLALLLILLSCLSGFTGCHHRIYTPRTLPLELAAETVLDVQRFNLSRLGGPAIRNEIIFPGDTLQVAIVTGGEEEHPEPWKLRVSDADTVDLPLVGSVRVTGLSLGEAEEIIRQASMRRQVFRNPTVRVTIGERRVNRVTITGAVKQPDTYELPATTSHLAAALLAAGGLDENADHFVEIRQISVDPARLMQPRPPATSIAPEFTSLRRDTPASAQYETVVVDLAGGPGNARRHYYLHDGSMVTVRRRPDRFVHLIGLTGNRTIDLPHNRDVRVLDALAQAGGPRYSTWIADRLNVIRPVPGSDDTVTIKVSIRKAKKDGRANILLASGDIVSVEENIVTFTLGTLGQLIGIGTTAATGAATGLAP